MSFISINKKTSTYEGKFKRTEIKCPHCHEPNLKLAWRGRNSQGKAEYTDVLTNSLHLCKDKYLNSVICKFCKQDGLKWVKSVNTVSGVELVNKTGKTHNCRKKVMNDYYSQIAYFFKYGYPNADKIEQEHQEYMNSIPPELKKQYAEENEGWRMHDFMAENGKCPCGCKKLPKSFNKRK